MKTITLMLLALTTLAISSARAQVTYTGTGNSLGSSPADGAAITSVVVNNDANNITFTINTTATQASYIFYSIELQIVGQAGNGSTSLVNPWGEHVGASTGLNALINTYSDSGASALTYSGGSWTQNASGAYAGGGAGFNYATITMPLTSLGLSAGNSFYFDVISTYAASPTGQSAYGALDSVTGYPAESDGSYQPWLGSNYYDSANAGTSGSTFGTPATLYTVTPVPEPAVNVLIVLGVFVTVGQAIRKKCFNSTMKLKP
jgi:hypothetical protein